MQSVTTLSNNWLKNTLLELLKFAKSSDKRIGRVEHRLDKVDGRLDKLEVNGEKVTNQLDSLVGMHKTTELEMVALKSGYKRHDKRICKLERHAGIPQSKIA